MLTIQVWQGIGFYLLFILNKIKNKYFLVKEPVITKSIKNWDLVIKPSYGWLNLNLRELLKYRDLVYLFVKRDFVIFYKQTILGPLWYIIQPLVNTVIFNLIFGIFVLFLHSKCDRFICVTLCPLFFAVM